MDWEVAWFVEREGGTRPGDAKQQQNRRGAARGQPKTGNVRVEAVTQN